MSFEHLRKKEDIENRASEWILRRDRGELLPENRAELEAWLSADSRHREAYLRLSDLWRFAGGLKVWRPADGEIKSDILSSFPERAKDGRRWPVSVAAAALLMLGMTAFWYVQERREVYTTTVGGYQRLLLNDGSILQLNTDSQVQVRITEQDRIVRLIRGEAYFDVAHDARRPFDVMAGDTVVRAVGTAFAVRLREAKRVDVLVTEGRVSVQEQGLDVKRSETAVGTRGASGRARSLLGAGQFAQAKPSGIRIATVEAAELARRLAWQSGVLHFNNRPLAEVVMEFNRYNSRHLEIVDPQLAALEVGGSFKANDIESFIAAIHGVGGIRVDQSADRIRLSASTP